MFPTLNLPPCSQEARRLDLTEFGNQFNNFNAGKILLYLQGFGGLRISNTEDSFTFADTLPTNWTFMEFRVPVMRRDRLSPVTCTTAADGALCVECTTVQFHATLKHGMEC